MTALPITFVTAQRVGEHKPQAGKVVVVVRPDRLRNDARWDDFGFKTTFDVFVAANGSPFENVGEWKILEVSERATSFVTTLPSAFSELPARYIALAQDISHYECLADLGPDIARGILRGLRDIAIVPPPFDVENVNGFKKSLVRFSPAHDAWVRGRTVLSKRAVIEHRNEAEAGFGFHFSCRLAGFEAPHTVDLAFSRSSEHLDLHRMWAIVGKNGVGKTRLLGSLARAVSGLEVDDAVLDPRPSFSRVIALSYSAWDAFPRPKHEGGPIAYVYGGLRSPEITDDHLVLDVARVRAVAAADLKALRADPQRAAQWCRALGDCLLDRRSSPLCRIVGGEDDYAEALSQSSAGEQFAAIVLTRLVAHLVPRTLVLFDEPELHMHPNLLAAVLRALHVLLAEYDSFALLATHSPFPLQEIPARCIQLITRVEDIPVARSLDDQTFGAALGQIVSTAFPADREDRNYASFLHQQLGKASAEAIIGALGSNPSTGVRLFLAAAQELTQER